MGRSALRHHRPDWLLASGKREYGRPRLAACAFRERITGRSALDLSGAQLASHEYRFGGMGCRPWLAATRWATGS
jgi:hypothetical protein